MYMCTSSADKNERLERSVFPEPCLVTFLRDCVTSRFSDNPPRSALKQFTCDVLHVYFECFSGPTSGISGKFLKLRLAVWRFQRLSGLPHQRARAASVVYDDAWCRCQTAEGGRRQTSQACVGQRGPACLVSTSLPGLAMACKLPLSER